VLILIAVRVFKADMRYLKMKKEDIFVCHKWRRSIIGVEEDSGSVG